MVGGNLCGKSNDQDVNWRDSQMADVRVVNRKVTRNSCKKMDLPMGYLKYVVLNKSFPVAILSGSFFFLVLSDMSRFLVFWCT